MPVELGIWRIEDKQTTPVKTSALADEATLEAILERDPSILGLDVLLIVGRQVITSFGTRIDLLAVDSDATLYVVEVKKGRTPRDVVAQALDYGYWVSALTLEELADIYAEHHDGESFETGFRERFDDDPPESLSGEHKLVVVASSFDPPTDRIVRYTREHGVPIYVVFFQYFKDGDQEFLTRTWDADPATPERPAQKVKKVRPPWNGQDFYVGFGEDEQRAWDDAVRYGFISAGGGEWYSRSLQALFPGARVFVCIPKAGYVGVGTVKETVRVGGAVIQFACATGMRPQEWQALERHDVNVGARTLRVSRTLRGGTVVPVAKTSSSLRTVMLQQRALDALATLPTPLDPHALVFTRADGGRIDLANFRRRTWTPALAAAGLDYRPPYECRHTFASLALSAGADIAWISRQLGHRSIATTLKFYARFLPAADSRALSLLDAFEADQGGRMEDARVDG